MTHKIFIFLLFFVVGCSTPDIWSESIGEEMATIRAFGGFIYVPAYMQIIVQKNAEDSFEIRMLKKMDYEGELESVIIQRPSQREEMNSDNLILVSQYEVNGFSVELFKPNRSKWEFDILAAQIERCGDVGQIIVKNQQFLDSYLATASFKECM